jgi:hypothetical protein
MVMVMRYVPAYIIIFNVYAARIEKPSERICAVHEGEKHEIIPIHNRQVILYKYAVRAYTYTADNTICRALDGRRTYDI